MATIKLPAVARAVITVIGILLLGACTEPDLSTPEGRAEHARVRAVAAEIKKHQWDSWDNYPKPQPMMICSGYTSTSRYISGGTTTMVCQ